MNSTKKLLLKNIFKTLSMNDSMDEWTNTDIFIEDGKISEIGPDLRYPGVASRDLSNQIVIPGLVNTHHHFFQSLTRAVPAAQNGDLFQWLRTLYPIWSSITPEMIRIATKTATLEMLLSGCTTSSDHLYLYPNGSTLDDSIEGARETGIRFHATRGAMTLGESHGGLPPDQLCEKEEKVLLEYERLISRYHDQDDGAMLRIALAPCSPFSVSRDFMRITAETARRHGVGLHTHLAENEDDLIFTREKFGCTPAQYAEELGWLGPDVWHAHCVRLDQNGIERFGQTRTGVAHCPCSNMRLGSGIAPVRNMLDHHVKVGIGVDGSASNDSNHVLAEARQAMLLQRVGGNVASLTARDALRLATKGGAEVLNRQDIGEIAVGKQADLVAFRADTLAMAGALSDPVAALVFTQPGRADYVWVQGSELVSGGKHNLVDEQEHIGRHNRCSMHLMEQI